MAVVPCDSCGRPMNEVAVICPHCNAKRAGVELGAKGKQLSQTEIRSLLVSDEILRAKQTKTKSLKILSGATLLDAVLWITGVRGATAYLVIGGIAAALITRAVLRARAARRRALPMT